MVSVIDEVRYGELLRARKPRKIESEEEFNHWATACEEIDMRETATPEERALSALMVVALVEYERNRYPDAFTSNPLRILKALMEENQMTQADLSRLLGVTRSTASQIFNGQRGISKQVAIKLSERFKMNAGAFLAK